MFIINAYRFLKNICSTTLNGSNEYVTVPFDSNIRFQIGQTRSFSFWVKTTGSANRIIISNLLTNAFLGFTAGIDTTGRVSFTIRRLNTEYIDIRSTNSFNDGNGHHVVITHNGSATASGIEIYVDKLQETKVIIRNDTTSAYISTDANNIGRNPAFSSYFNGSLDKLIFYNKELTAGEVTTLYNYGRKAGDVGISGVVSQWEMDALNPPDVVGSNNGTSVNMDASNIVCE